MKLESLKKMKFDAFKKSEMLVSISIVGGTQIDTKKKAGGPVTDCWDDSTGDDIHTDHGDFDGVNLAAPGLAAPGLA